MADLVDYRVSYGECIGFCTSVLTIDGSTIELVQTSEHPPEPSRRFLGILAADLVEEIDRAAAVVQVERLERVYGEPDAHDEGAVTVRLHASGGITAHSYSRGMPPDDLAALDALLSPVVLGWIDGDPPPGAWFNEIP
ncbi:MAG: hypothetical protein ABFR53_10290 [Actinomycetota bacterium]